MITIVIPATAKSNQNRRENWGQRSRRVRGEHGWLREHVLDGLEKPSGELPQYLMAHIYHHLPTGHKRDLDGLDDGTKSWIDEICKWLEIDDERTSCRYTERIYKSPLGSQTIIRLTPAPTGGTYK